MYILILRSFSGRPHSFNPILFTIPNLILTVAHLFSSRSPGKLVSSRIVYLSGLSQSRTIYLYDILPSAFLFNAKALPSISERKSYSFLFSAKYSSMVSVVYPLHPLCIRRYKLAVLKSFVEPVNTTIVSSSQFAVVKPYFVLLKVRNLLSVSIS